MAVVRIVPNLDAAEPGDVARFYRDLFGLESVMDQGWIITLAGAEAQPMQLSIASEGGSGTPVPGLSIEVDDLDATLARAGAMGLTPEYGPVSEPWGVRRFYLRDPAGTLINILSHGSDTDV